MIRLGLVGVGAWGRRYIARIQCRTDCTIAAVARATGTAEGIVEGAEACADWGLVLRRAEAGDLDAVVGATTPSHQAQLAAACVQAGVPLLVEKPLGLSLTEAEAVRAAVDARGSVAPLMVNYIHLWAPAFVRLRSLVADAGGAPAIVRMASAGHKVGPFRSWSTLYDYAPHDLAMAFSLRGLDVSARLMEATSLPPTDPRGELCQINLDLGGVPFAMRVGNGATQRARSFSVQLADGRLLVYDDTQEHPRKLFAARTSLDIDQTGPLDRVLDAFLAATLRWKAGDHSAARTLESVQLSCRINAVIDEVLATLDAKRALR